MDFRRQTLKTGRLGAAGLALCAGSLLWATPAVDAQTPSPIGAETISTEAASVSDAAAEVEAAVVDAGFNITSVIEHDSIIRSKTDIDLRPTQLVIFENPAVDGELLRANRAVGLDLPQKILVWEDVDGTVKISYNKASYVADRHGLDGLSSELRKMDATTAGLVRNIGSEATAGATSDATTTAPPPTVAEVDAPSDDTAAELPVTGASSTVMMIGTSILLLSSGGALMFVSRRRVGGVTVVLALVVAATAVPVASPERVEAQTSDNGVITVVSEHGVQFTLEQVREAAANNKFGVLLTVAQSSGDMDELPPTFLVMLGRPAINGPILEANQTTGIDLPQKMLVWEDESGATLITYNDPSYLEERHSLDNASDSLDELGDLLGTIAEEAASA